MTKIILTFTTLITIIARGTSGYIATLPNPTDVQKNLANTTNAVTIAGTTAIFGLLSKQNKNS